MQAVILAAGMGTRLKPLTDTQPKCLTEVGGMPLLVNALRQLEAAGVEETILVTGYLEQRVRECAGERLGKMKISYIHNPDYARTNNVYSLFLAAAQVRGAFLLVECDLFFGADALEALLAAPGECAMLVSPFDPATMDGTVVRADPDGRVRELIVKKRQGAGFDVRGALKTVNLYRFSGAFALERFFPALQTYVRTQSVNSYYEVVLGSLIYFGNDDIRAVSIDPARWAEVDTAADLALAEAKFSKKAAPRA